MKKDVFCDILINIIRGLSDAYDRVVLRANRRFSGTVSVRIVVRLHGAHLSSKRFDIETISYGQMVLLFMLAFSTPVSAFFILHKIFIVLDKQCIVAKVLLK